MTCDDFKRSFLVKEEDDCVWTGINASMEDVGWQSVCMYVTCVDGCLPEEGFVNYFKLPFCSFRGSLAAATPLLVLWLLILFLALGLVADNFFCPCLASMSDTLGLSQNVAGVTLLALGNGAPDLFSTFSAIQSSSDSNDAAALAVGEMYGAGMFVVAVVVSGLVCAAGRFRIARRPFIRDLVVYLLAILWLLFVFHDGVVTLLEAILCICLYFIYVLVVAIGPKVYRHLQLKRSADGDLELQGPSEASGSEERNYDISSSTARISSSTARISGSIARQISLFASYAESSDSESEQVEDPEETTETTDVDSSDSHSIAKTESEWQVVLRRLQPFSRQEFLSQGCCGKVFGIIQAPLLVLLKMAILYVDPDDADEGWSRYLYAIQINTSSSIIIFGCKVAFVQLGASGIPLLVPVLGVALVAAASVLCCTGEKPPRFHRAFAFLAFAVCMVCSYVIANELVEVLQVLGNIFGVSNAILGATVLAWGNSIGDLVANSAMAKNGYPQMAFGACFGGPALNVLLGMGVASTYKAATSEGHLFLLQSPSSRTKLFFSGGFLAGMLASLLIVVAVTRFHIGKPVAIYLSFLYLIFLAAVISIEVVGV